MNEYVCDDRENMEELLRKIRNMSDEEFECHITKLKEEAEKQRTTSQ